MADITEYLEQIENAVYGKDVRQAIHDGIEQCYEDGKAGAIDLTARSQIASVNSDLQTSKTSLQNQIDEIVAPEGDPSLTEVANARIDAEGTTHETLKERCDSDVGKVNELKSELNNYGLIAFIKGLSEFANLQKVSITHGTGAENIAGYYRTTPYIAVSKGDYVYYNLYSASDLDGISFFTSMSVDSYSEGINNCREKTSPSLYIVPNDGYIRASCNVNNATSPIICVLGSYMLDINKIKSNVESINYLLNKYEGEELCLDITLGAFNQTDLSIDITGEGRGRTNIFTLPEQKIKLSLQVANGISYQYHVFKQTFSGGVQTTTLLTSTWQSGQIDLIGEDGANYRCLIKRNPDALMSSDDLTKVKIIASTVEDTRLEALHKTVPIYPLNEAKLIQTIKSVKNQNTIVFCAAADPHYNSFDFKDNHQTAWAKRMAYISEQIGVDFITVLGDMTEGYNDQYLLEDYTEQYVNSKRVQEMVDAYTAYGTPFMYVAGHHECAPIYEDTNAYNTLNNGDSFVQNRAFYTSELKPMVYGISTLARLKTNQYYGVGHRKFVNKITDISDPNMSNSTLDKTGSTSCSYYFDITKNGNTVRFLVVDGTHMTWNGYAPETVTFVETALRTAHTNGYKVVVMNHIPIRMNEYFLGLYADAKNDTAFINVLKTYASDIILYLHGHVHCDNIVTATTERQDTGTYPYSDISFPMVSISCQKTGGVPNPVIGDYTGYGIRTIDVYSGYCFDTVTVDASTGAVKFYRFGAGDIGTYPTRVVNND